MRLRGLAFALALSLGWLMPAATAPAVDDDVVLSASPPVLTLDASGRGTVRIANELGKEGVTP